jgi:hypothetical protein
VCGLKNLGRAEELYAGRLHAPPKGDKGSLSLGARAARGGGASPRALFFLDPSIRRISVRGTEEEHTMPALETKETQAPRSALLHPS